MLVESDRKRTRTPLGDSPRFHTACGIWSLSRLGKRINSPLFSVSQGAPWMSNRASVGAIHRKLAAASRSWLIAYQDTWLTGSISLQKHLWAVRSAGTHRDRWIRHTVGQPYLVRQ